MAYDAQARVVAALPFSLPGPRRSAHPAHERPVNFPIPPELFPHAIALALALIALGALLYAKRPVRVLAVMAALLGTAWLALAGFAAHDYFTGQALAVGSQDEFTQCGSLDRQLRVPTACGHVRWTLDYRLRLQQPIFRLLRRWAGPAPNSYEGPYPVPEEAARLLATQGVVLERQDLPGVVALAGRAYAFGTSGAFSPLRVFDQRAVSQNEPLYAAACGEHCAVLGFRHANSLCIFLFDARLGWFAQYAHVPDLLE